jgi:D-threo-aldose 1-dehydrogenase
MIPILRDWDFDALITHNRFTLVNRHAEEMIALAAERGVSVFNAAPYATGALAKGTATCKRYVYRDATPGTLAPVVRVEEVCARHGVPPGAAALQFSLREPRVTATICGVSRPERVAQTLEWAAFPIPEEAWAELLALPFTTQDPERDRDHEPG